MPKKKPPLSWNTVEHYTLDELLTELAPKLLAEIPLGVRSDDDLDLASTLLGRFSSEFAFVKTLKIKMAALASELSSTRTDETYKRYVQIRDGLDGICDGLKMKYEAVSRMITVLHESNSDQRVGAGWSSVPRQTR